VHIQTSGVGLLGDDAVAQIGDHAVRLAQIAVALLLDDDDDDDDDDFA
jgi:hypothetical protein